MTGGKPNLSDIYYNKTLSRSNVVIFCKVLSNPGDSTEFIIATLTGCAAMEKGRRIERNYARNDIVTSRNTPERKH